MVACLGPGGEGGHMSVTLSAKQPQADPLGRGADVQAFCALSRRFIRA
ncbi:hypothetical protein SAMN06297251_106170 [Fulvimarina manganoxydans]|uniref:Uncharacterized protein n=1 Tax=Fulvimarina manganoxydans TaxID=937218 RepID=A0A1W2BJT2_9HYPH|nr:hypothetical protein SAMN06297251_106170 [Fulvimarina manganoxydans]